VARPPTVTIVASDQHRNGKTLLARMLADYLLLDNLDPFLIDTDAPDGPLRTFFPGRTLLADFTQTKGQIKIFDTVLASTGRDYVIDLTAEHTRDFFDFAQAMEFFSEASKRGFFIVVMFIVDNSYESVALARSIDERAGVNMVVPVRNAAIGSFWPKDEWAFQVPALDDKIFTRIALRRFSFREFVMGDLQTLPKQYDMELKRFVYQVMQGFNDLEQIISLRAGQLQV
jgi:hypothetical protein